VEHASVSRSAALYQVLAAVGDGVGCEHWTVPDYGVPVALLVDLGLASPIKTRVPCCAEHGCRYLGRCAYEAEFEPAGAAASSTAPSPARAPRAGRKFRLTAAGHRALTAPLDLAAALAALPLTDLLLAELAGGERTLFALVGALVERVRQAIAAGAAPEAARVPTRPYLRAVLELLVEQGVLEWDPTTDTVRRRPAPHTEGQA
jgi:hypothetical protein